MEQSINVAILASGNGSNAENIYQYFKNNEKVLVKLLISNKENAKVLEKFSKTSIDKQFIPFNEYFNESVIKLLIEKDIKLICLAGFMRVLSKEFLQFLKQHNILIINIHPSYLPEFKGLNAYEKAFRAPQNYSGVSVHFVDEGVDTGKIILQEKLLKHENDTFEDFHQRGLNLEYKLYPKAIEKVIEHLKESYFEKTN